MRRTARRELCQGLAPGPAVKQRARQQLAGFLYNLDAGYRLNKNVLSAHNANGIDLTGKGHGASLDLPRNVVENGHVRSFELAIDLLVHRSFLRAGRYIVLGTRGERESNNCD